MEDFVVETALGAAKGNQEIAASILGLNRPSFIYASQSQKNQFSQAAIFLSLPPPANKLALYIFTTGYISTHFQPVATPKCFTDVFSCFIQDFLFL
jgi:hypothetical protein